MDTTVDHFTPLALRVRGKKDTVCLLDLRNVYIEEGISDVVSLSASNT